MTTTAPTIDPGVYARRWKTLAVLSLSLVIIGLDNTVLNVALPSLPNVIATTPLDSLISFTSAGL